MTFVQWDAAGVLHIGTDAWFDCAWCGTHFDPAWFRTCPVCERASRQLEREHKEALFRALDEQEFDA